MRYGVSFDSYNFFSFQSNNSLELTEFYQNVQQVVLVNQNHFIGRDSIAICNHNIDGIF